MKPEAERAGAAALRARRGAGIPGNRRAAGAVREPGEAPRRGGVKRGGREHTRAPETLGSLSYQRWNPIFPVTATGFYICRTQDNSTSKLSADLWFYHYGK